MTETVSEVYDLAYPSPITLKEISSIAVVAKLWRREIYAYLESNNSRKFILPKHIRLKNLIPDMPSTIYNQLSSYTMFRKSIKEWVWYHRGKVFSSENNYSTEGSCLNDILSRFHDFSWDWNGAIHYVRTAKRMLQCDRFSLEEKFIIACLYCFEDDIKRIWPSVSTKIDLKKFGLYEFPQLFYWANELHMSPYSSYPLDHDLSIYEILSLSNPHNSHNHSSLEYFWNRIPFNRREATVILMHIKYVELFARFIVQQLREHELEVFLARRASGLIFSLLICDFGRCSVLPTWMYIRNKMSGDQFHILIMDLLFIEAMGDLIEESLTLCLEIWYSSPQHIKQPIFDDLVFKEQRFLRFRWTIRPSKPKRMKLLIAVLHDATLEERSAFWHKHWRALIRGTVIKDLYELIKLCFRNEDEISLFKSDIMCKYANIEYYCITYLKEGRVNKLNEYLDFCCIDKQKRRQLKQRLLREYCFSKVNDRLYHAFKPLNKFIDDAFERNDDRVEFKNQFISSPRTEKFLIECISEGDFMLPMEFVDTFVSEQQAIVSLKSRLFDRFKEQLIDGWFRTVQRVNIDHVRRILIWLLGKEDEVTRFKQSLPVDNIFRNIVKKRGTRRAGDKRNEFQGKLDNFLKWYFNEDGKKIESFKRRFPKMN
ncbi:uncharacterized protein LOC135834076 [Planococcus citri]|uniref:uncharacterized protein LOC135834076 n=1 Tax=Planococcus citri TaxID=170843 RepID=UPI0031F9986B